MAWDLNLSDTVRLRAVILRLSVKSEGSSERQLST